MLNIHCILTRMCDDGFDDRILILLCANSYILYQLTPKYHMSYLKIHVIYTWASLKKKKNQIQ